MLFPVDLMQKIVVKNMTEDVLSDIEISHNGEWRLRCKHNSNRQGRLKLNIFIRN
ncbi:hypothetical protein [Romboutsia sp.]|uniref:hypothetical protein n=1 Tax=Romboutsia sp. TaxID=1965302 RepID=UPI003F3ABF40